MGILNGESVTHSEPGALVKVILQMYPFIASLQPLALPTETISTTRFETLVSVVSIPKEILSSLQCDAVTSVNVKPAVQCHRYQAFLSMFHLSITY